MGFYSKMNPAEKAASHLPELWIISFYLPAQSHSDLRSSAGQQNAFSPQAQPCHPRYGWSVCPSWVTAIPPASTSAQSIVP